jgi:hypothetical protein
MQCESTDLYVHNGKTSNFCATHFREMFPKAFKRTAWERDHGPIQQATLDGYVSRFALLGETAYRQKKLQYTSSIDDKSMMSMDEFKKRTSLKLNGQAPNCHATGKKFTPKASANQAVRGFFTGTTYCECHNFVLAVYYRALLELLGDSKFDRVFKELVIEVSIDFQKNPKNPLWSVLSMFDVEPDGSNVRVGDWVYCVNWSDFSQRHPGGEAVGWNLICVSLTTGTKPEPEYVGLGLGDVGQTPVKGLAWNAIEGLLDAEYKKAPPKQDRDGTMSRLNLDVMRIGAFDDAPKPKSKSTGQTQSFGSRPSGRNVPPHIDVSKKGMRLDVEKLITRMFLREYD